jgi:hypothetical protein
VSESDVLLTFSEVSVAFAGFASLVGMLGRRSSADDPRVLGFRMRAMLLTSLIVVGFSIFPVVLMGYGASQTVIWTASSLVLLGVTGRYAMWFGRSLRALRGAGVITTRLQQRVIIPTLTINLGGLVTLLVLNVFLATPAVYLTALASLLFQAGFAFCLIVFSFLPRVDAAAGEGTVGEQPGVAAPTGRPYDVAAKGDRRQME